MKKNTRVINVYKSSKIIKEIFKKIHSQIFENNSTLNINNWIETEIYNLGGIPGAKNYKNYPYSSCISINNELCHGLPKKDKFLKNGDLVKIDIIVEYNGYFSDGAETFIVGDSTKYFTKKMFLENSKKIMNAGIYSCVSGNSLWDIAFAIRKEASRLNLNIVDCFCGHFIDSEIHKKPQIPYFLSEETKQYKLKSGDILTIEPIVTLKPVSVFLSDDKWTYFYKEQSILSSHFEKTILINGKKTLILN